MHGIAQAVLTPVGLLWPSVIANPTEVDVHHFRVMRYNVRRWHLLRFYPTRVTVVQQERSAGLGTDENR